LYQYHDCHEDQDNFSVKGNKNDNDEDNTILHEYIIINVNNNNNCNIKKQEIIKHRRKENESTRKNYPKYCNHMIIKENKESCKIQEMGINILHGNNSNHKENNNEIYIETDI